MKLSKLEGSVELGPVVGLADAIVDIVETGNTLSANGLEVIEKISDISTRMIVNKSGSNLKKIRFIEMVERLEKMLKQIDYQGKLEEIAEKLLQGSKNRSIKRS